MRFSHIPAALIVSLGLIWPGSASAVTVQSIAGIWTGSDPIVSGLGTSEIHWGESTGHGLSGYSFSSAAAPMELTPDETFYLGTFTHINKPIRGTLLSSAELTVSFFLDGLSEAFSSVFTFDHWETHNQARTCANGGANYSGVNISGCADRVTATLNESRSDSFVIDGISYVMDISGFEYSGAALDSFWTRESRDNEAHLVGILRAVDGQVPSPVPLPASAMFVLSGLAGLAMTGRRRKAASDV